jgi:hypothetical protein
LTFLCSAKNCELSGRRIANRLPDPSLYTFMQCLNVYKKYGPGRGQGDIFYVNKKFMQIYVDIKIYRPGHDVYVRFMFLHKRVYYMYTRLCEFRQAPIIMLKFKLLLLIHATRIRVSCLHRVTPHYIRFFVYSPLRPFDRRATKGRSGPHYVLSSIVYSEKQRERGKRP